MPRILIADGDGRSLSAEEGVAGETLMDVLRRRGAVEAACGGNCSCATCHVHIDPAWWDAVGPPGEDEALLLEYSIEKQPTSRLSCQVRLQDSMDGLKLKVAPREG